MKKIFLTILGTAFAVLSGQQEKHTVVAKENPTTIAKKYGVSVDELIKQNPKIKDGKIDIGDVLIIPNKQKNTQKKKSLLKRNLIRNWARFIFSQNRPSMV